MKLNSERLKQAVRGVGQNKVADHLGINKNTMVLRMKRPESLRLHEFLSICRFLEESPDRFIIEKD